MIYYESINIPFFYGFLAIHVETKIVKQLLSGIVSHFLLTVVHSGNLKNYCKISSWLNGNSAARHFYPENRGVLVVYAHAVVYLFAVPWLKFDDHVDLFRYFDRTHAEQTACVDDTYTADF